jgi:NAD(P)-dependent dehydrogenase (short-subunit alcohol dehydrogenase family)
MPSQAGRTAVVTGTGGLGYQDALGLARAGADVIIAGRNAAKGAAAVEEIGRVVPGAAVRFELLDLASLQSIAAFSARIRGERQSIDLLINNAAVMAPPRRTITADGFELQLGTNYLGHFALTARLLALLQKGRNPRVISVSALAARGGEINFDDLQAERTYRPWAVYSQSKLANLVFSFELQRRSDAAGWGLMSIAAHPGISRTDLVANGFGRKSAVSVMMKLVGPMLFQAAAQGALPTLFSATSPLAKPGAYYGPDSRSEMRGTPATARVPPQAEDTDVARRLWDLSEGLVHVTFDAHAGASPELPPAGGSPGTGAKGTGMHELTRDA